MSQSYSIRGSTELPLRSLSLLINSSARRKETYILGWFAVSVAGLSDELLLGVFYWPLRMINCMGLYSETAKVSQPNKQQPQSLEEKKKIIDGWRGWLMDFVEFYRLYVVPQWVLWCSWGGRLACLLISSRFLPAKWSFSWWTRLSFLALNGGSWNDV